MEDMCECEQLCPDYIVKDHSEDGRLVGEDEWQEDDDFLGGANYDPFDSQPMSSPLLKSRIPSPEKLSLSAASKTSEPGMSPPKNDDGKRARIEEAEETYSKSGPSGND